MAGRYFNRADGSGYLINAVKHVTDSDQQPNELDHNQHNKNSS